MTLVDWLALAVVLLAALSGLRRGLILTAFSLAGLALGAYVGLRVAPHLLNGGSSSLWIGVAGLAGAVVGAGLFQAVAVIAGSRLRGRLRLKPLRVVDSAGGLVLGTLIGIAIVWVCAAIVLDAPPERLGAVGNDVQRSWIVRKLDSALPSSRLNAVLPLFLGPSVPTLPPSVGVLRNPRIRASLTRVVKVLGTACGEGVEGSGWFARRDLVVTAAHVVAGERSTIVQVPSDPNNYAATVVVFDPHNDIAVLRISGTTAQPLRLADPQEGASVAIVGYPLDGDLSAIPGRVGGTANEFTQDALGNRVVRAITAIAGHVHHGDSGGPVIDTHGDVEATIFAAKKGSPSGYAVPTSIVRSDLAKAGRRAVSTATCAP